MSSCCSESSEEKSLAPSTYTVGEKIKVWYSKGKFLKSYVAKVSCIIMLIALYRHDIILDHG